MLKYICLNTQRDAIESNDASDIRDAVQAIDDLKAALTLDQGVADTSALSVPVRVTLPIPANINPGFLVILHYDSAGNPAAISDPYIYQEGGKWMTSFVVDHFSPFALTEYTALPLTKDMFTVDTADAAHTGSPITKTITSELVLDRDYTVSYSNNTNVGTAAIVITGIGNYSGELTYTFNIKAGSVDGSNGPSGGSSRPSINTGKTPSADDKQDDTTQTVWENPYPDVAADAWYYNAVKYVSENGLMKGYANGQFGAEDAMTRAQLAQILYNKEGAPAVSGVKSFNDVSDDAWYADAIIWAASAGIVNGYENGSFGPNDTLTREQATAIIWRYAGKPAASGGLNGFNDAGSISNWAGDAMNWAVNQGIVNGKDGGVLAPSSGMTRAEIATVLMRFLTK